MENKSKRIEEIFKQDLSMYLTGRQRVDEQLPDAPDIEEQWTKIGESYLPDAMREFSKYPTVALGWIMFVGMAIAKYWDEDWELYGKVDNLYEYLRDRIDFDHMDDYILDQVLLLDENEHKATSTTLKIVTEHSAFTICSRDNHLNATSISPQDLGTMEVGTTEPRTTLPTHGSAKAPAPTTRMPSNTHSSCTT